MPEDAGGFDGLQAEKARIPFACANLVRLPDEVADEEAILCSDVFPTGWFGAENAEVGPGDTVAVLGCGPVGQFAILSAKMLGAGRIFAVDCLPDRLEMARSLGAEAIDFSKENPIEAILGSTGGIGVDRAIDAVGIDAESPKGDPHDRKPGDAPAQALDWAVDLMAKAGTLSVVGVYPSSFDKFPIGKAMNRNFTIKMGNCNHRRYVPKLLDLVRSGEADVRFVVTQRKPLEEVIDALQKFDARLMGWIKVELETAAAPAA